MKLKNLERKDWYRKMKRTGKRICMTMLAAALLVSCSATTIFAGEAAMPEEPEGAEAAVLLIDESDCVESEADILAEIGTAAIVSENANVIEISANEDMNDAEIDADVNAAIEDVATTEIVMVEEVQAVSDGTDAVETGAEDANAAEEAKADTEGNVEEIAAEVSAMTEDVNAEEAGAESIAADETNSADTSEQVLATDKAEIADIPEQTQDVAAETISDLPASSDEMLQVQPADLLVEEQDAEDAVALFAEEAQETTHVHTVVIDLRVEPTCKETGLEEGSHCSECEEIIIAQKEIPATGHNYVKGVCKNCGQIKNGFAYVNGKWGYYKNQELQNETGLIKGTIGSKTAYFYVQNGVYTKKTGLTYRVYGNNSHLFFVKKGVYTKASGVAKRLDISGSILYYVKNGVFKAKTGIARKADKSNNVWYYVKNGVYDPSAKLIAKKADGSSKVKYYVKNGKLKKTTGKVTLGDTIYTLKNGKVNASALNVAAIQKAIKGSYIIWDGERWIFNGNTMTYERFSGETGSVGYRSTHALTFAKSGNKIKITAKNYYNSAVGSTFYYYPGSGALYLGNYRLFRTTR